MPRQSPLEWMARIGYAARGIVFLIIGGFAGFAATTGGHRALDSKDALRTLLGEPLGYVLLAIVAAGLLCFAAWRLAQALLDADHIGAAPKALARRAFYAAAALFYASSAVVVATLILGWDLGGNSDRMARDGTSWLLGLPFGRLLIGAIGLTFVGTGIGIGVAGCQARFRQRIELKKDGRRIVTALGSFGFAARAMVFAMIGLCLLFAAYSSHSSDAKGFAGALLVLQQQPYGAAWLGVLAAGLFAFGLYGLAEAAYRRITPPLLAHSLTMTA